MGGLGQVACQGPWLGKPALVFWWVELDLFSLECNEVSSSDFWVVYEFGKALAACLLMLRAFFCVTGELVWYVLL